MGLSRTSSTITTGTTHLAIRSNTENRRKPRKAILPSGTNITIGLGGENRDRQPDICLVDPKGRFVSVDDAEKRPLSPARVYEVHKKVSDFPDREDLTTPEAADATIHRAYAAEGLGAFQRLSVPPLASASRRRCKMSVGQGGGGTAPRRGRSGSPCLGQDSRRRDRPRRIVRGPRPPLRFAMVDPRG